MMKRGVFGGGRVAFSARFDGRICETMRKIFMHFYDTSVPIFTCTFMRSCTVPSFSHTHAPLSPSSV